MSTHNGGWFLGDVVGTIVATTNANGYTTYTVLVRSVVGTEAGGNPRIMEFTFTVRTRTSQKTTPTKLHNVTTSMIAQRRFWRTPWRACVTSSPTARMCKSTSQC